MACGSEGLGVHDELGVTGEVERCEADGDDGDLALWLLDEAHVATVSGSAFGAPGYIRFSYATNEARIRDGLDAIRRTLSAARK